MNLYKKNIYKKSLQHGQKWRDHKYLYIDSNGNYVYPKDAGRKIRQRLVGYTEQEKKDQKFLDYLPPAGTNKKNDQIASAHRNAVIKKKNLDTGRSYIEDRREHDSNVAKALRAAKDYSKQISREHENEEASRKVNKKEKLRDIRARKVSKGIEDRFKESELARDFDSKAKKRKKKKVLQHSNTYRSNVMNSHQRMIYSSQLQHAERRNHKYLYKIGDRYIYPEDVAKGKNGGYSSGGRSFEVNEERERNRKLRRQEEKIAAINKKNQEMYPGDREFVEESKKRRQQEQKDRSFVYEGRQINSNDTKRIHQTRSAHQGAVWQTGSVGSTHEWSDGTKRDTGKVDPTHRSKNLKTNNNISTGSSRKIEANKKYSERDRKDSQYGVLTWANNPNDPKHEKGYDVVDGTSIHKQQYRTDVRKAQKARDEKSEAQRKSAHAGYEADKKAFPEGGSTEELERQKIKTKARKTKVRTEAGVEAGRDRVKKLKTKSVEVKETSVKPITVKPITIKGSGTSTMTENEKLRRGLIKKKKKKPTVKGSKKVTTWDNAKIKKW